MEKLKGLGVAMVTPFTNEKEVDYNALEKLTNHMIDGGVDYLVVMGTTGEAVTLSKTEQQDVLDFIIKINNNRLPIVFGIGGNDTKTLVESYHSFNLEGVDAILSASPNYNKPSQEGIYQHYKYLAENMNHPIILYNVPGRTASNVLPSTIIRIASEFKSIVAVKEASGNIMQVMELIENKPKGFLVISGDDALTLPFISCGADGLISVIGNALPVETKSLVSNSLKGDFETARVSHYKLLGLIEGIFADGNPAGVKELLNEMDIMKTDVRLPLVNVNSGVQNTLKNLLKGLK